MTINQIYSVMNDISENIVEGGANVVDTSTFVKFGEDVLSSQTNKEKWFNSLVDRIGKTIIAIRQYKASGRNVTVDSFTFGSILQKISYRLTEAEESPQWNTTGSLNPYTMTQKTGIVQKLYAQDMPTFSFLDVIPDYQVESAWTTPTAMSGFISGLYTRMENGKAVAIEGMENYAIASLYAKVYEQSTATQPVNARRCRNLLAEYNTLHPTATLTTDNCLETPSFLEFMAIEISMASKGLEKYTTMYNDGTVERFSTKENQIVEIPTYVNKSFEVYLKSNTFHNELVALPNFNEVLYWTSPDDGFDIKVDLGNENVVTIPNVICAIRDKDSVACTLEREDTASMYDSINRRTYVRMSADRRYVIDTSENCVIFYIDNPVITS